MITFFKNEEYQGIGVAFLLVLSIFAFINYKVK